MKRKRTIRRVARITPVAVEARRQCLEVAGAVAACEKARAAAEKRARINGNYADYHRRLPPCGEPCACMLEHEAERVIRQALGVRPWDFGSVREAELYAELDRELQQAQR